MGDSHSWIYPYRDGWRPKPRTSPSSLTPRFLIFEVYPRSFVPACPQYRTRTVYSAPTRSKAFLTPSSWRGFSSGSWGCSRVRNLSTISSNISITNIINNGSSYVHRCRWRSSRTRSSFLFLSRGHCQRGVRIREAGHWFDC